MHVTSESGIFSRPRRGTSYRSRWSTSRRSGLLAVPSGLQAWPAESVPRTASGGSAHLLPRYEPPARMRYIFGLSFRRYRESCSTGGGRNIGLGVFCFNPVLPRMLYDDVAGRAHCSVGSRREIGYADIRAHAFASGQSRVGCHRVTVCVVHIQTITDTSRIVNYPC
jgi:hypothetical protein